ncbi:MAG: S1 RNA-binding domain-containing protein, partial [Thermoguttaceae bacterium]
GRDPREDLPAPVFKRGVIKLEDLSPGMELTGTVLNVVDFGCFVDIGMHDSGLVHVSRLADRFIRDPHDVVAVGDIVRVWVMEVDKERRRVSLTMVRPGSERPKPQPKSNRPAADHGKPQPKGTRPAPHEKRPPRPPQRQNRPPHGQQHQNRPPRPPRPKPVIPITEAMKNGKEPMRTFSDLFQFYQQKPAEEPQPAPTVENPPPESES